MTKNEIKKALYKEKPVAIEADVIEADNLINAKPYSTYRAILNNGRRVAFSIPHREMGDNRFPYRLPAQLLIRWLID